MTNGALKHLDTDVPRIVMFCGKGGVGKTTCAASTAYHFAKKGLKVLLISSDPTPSLSDILEADVRGSIKEIENVDGLEAVELDYDTIIEMWKEKFGDEVYEAISSFLPVEKDIIEYIANAPGIDEEFALSYVYDLYMSEKYDVITWDTAPAGGTLTLIKLQDKFYRHLGEAAKLYVRVRKALKALVRGEAKRDPLNIIGDWEKLAREVLDMLKDEGTQAIVVTIPEALGVNQTTRVINELESFGIRVGKVLVNYVLNGDISSSDLYNRRSTMQKKYIQILEEQYGGRFGIGKLQLQPFEVKGIDSIAKVEAVLF